MTRTVGTWNYTLEKGAADCFEGIADIVAKDLSMQNEWLALGLIANLKEHDLKDAISKTLDIMCKDVKNNVQLKFRKFRWIGQGVSW